MALMDPKLVDALADLIRAVTFGFVICIFGLVMRACT